MKKLLYSTLLLAGILSVNETIAQDWDLAGNNVGPNARLGTNNNRPLRIQTNGIQQSLYFIMLADYPIFGFNKTKT